jgi:hypothetical protein
MTRAQPNPSLVRTPVGGAQFQRSVAPRPFSQFQCPEGLDSGNSPEANADGCL